MRESSIPEGFFGEAWLDDEPDEPEPDEPEPDEPEPDEPEPDKPDKPEFRLFASRPSYIFIFPLASLTFILLPQDEEPGFSVTVQVIWPAELQSAKDSL